MKVHFTLTLFTLGILSLNAQTGLSAFFNPGVDLPPQNSFSQLLLSLEEVRPFITDDARVVGEHYAQLESWYRFDREAGQLWFIGAYGPKQWLEISAGGVFGYENNKSEVDFSYALPLVQAKFLFREYCPGQLPGVGMVIGSFFPGGQGSFKPPGYGTFGFMTISQCFGEGDKVLLHLNLGANYLHIDDADELLGTWGFGTQIKAYQGMHLVAEIFSGDPYVPGTGLAYQIGYRYFFSDLFQIDMTLGNGIGGATPLPFWFSGGVRIVTEKFRKKKGLP